MIGAFLLASCLELVDDVTDERIDCFGLVGILYGAIDQPFHILLALLPVRVALAPAMP